MITHTPDDTHTPNDHTHTVTHTPDDHTHYKMLTHTPDDHTHTRGSHTHQTITHTPDATRTLQMPHAFNPIDMLLTQGRVAMQCNGDDVVVGVGQLSTLVMLGPRLHMDFITHGRLKLWLDLRPVVAYLDGTSAILERFGGKEVHHFLLGIEANKMSRKLKLEQWANEAAVERKAGYHAAHSYGKPPPGLTIMETLLSDGYHDANYLKGALDNFVNWLLRSSPKGCNSVADLRRDGLLPLVMMLDCDLAEGNAVLLSFNGMDIVAFSIKMRGTLANHDRFESLQSYVQRLIEGGVNLCIPAWCFRHNVKNFYEYPLHTTSLKECVEAGYVCEHFSRLSAGSDEDGAGSDDGAETVSPPSNAKKQRNTKRGRLSQLSSAWCCAFTNSRSEAWLVAVSDVAAVVLNSSTVPEECIVDCPRTDLVAETKSYFDSTKLELKKLAREPTHDVTFNDVVSHLKRIPANDRHSSLLRIWVIEGISN